MVDALAPGAVFALPEDCVYCFPSQYPYPGEVFNPVWKGSNCTVPCVMVSPHGMAMSAPSASKRVLLFHGNGETLEGARVLASELATHCGAYVFIVEYPGYWRPERGEPATRTAAGAYANAATATRLLAKSGGPLHLVGYSLGTALAVRIAKDMGPGTPLACVQSLTLIAPICSALGVAATSPAEGLPPGLRPLLAFMKPLLSSLDVFCADRDAPGVKVRSAVVYGSLDEVVNNSQGARMASLLKTTPLVVPGENHTSVVGSPSTIAFIRKNIYDSQM